ncbi:MAG: hypothetical protein JOZ82_00265 [Marmoricola sp.]|nr:hypothetical protein [Marmoricola sp.]
MNLRRIASAVAAALLTVGLAGVATTSAASADLGAGKMHTSDTGWGKI